MAKRWAKRSEPMSLLPGNRRALVAGFVLVDLIGLGVGGTIWALQGRLPEPMATHFSGGSPDGFGSVSSVALAAAVVTMGVGGIVAGLAVVQPGPRAGRRALYGLGIGLAVFVAVLFLLMTLAQLDLANAQMARLSWEAALASAVLGASVGLATSPLIRE